MAHAMVAAMAMGIDDSVKVVRLLAGMKAALPLSCSVTPHLAEELRRQVPDMAIPTRCLVTDVHYSGDEGGIVCRLDFGDRRLEKKEFIVSMTHIAFVGGGSLAREIAAYIKHRIKRLRRLEGRPSQKINWG
jgi:hypothetical protein